MLRAWVSGIGVLISVCLILGLGAIAWVSYVWLGSEISDLLKVMAHPRLGQEQFDFDMAAIGVFLLAVLALAMVPTFFLIGFLICQLTSWRIVTAFLRRRGLLSR